MHLGACTVHSASPLSLLKETNMNYLLTLFLWKMPWPVRTQKLLRRQTSKTQNEIIVCAVRLMQGQGLPKEIHIFLSCWVMNFLHINICSFLFNETSLLVLNMKARYNLKEPQALMEPTRIMTPSWAEVIRKLLLTAVNKDWKQGEMAVLVLYEGNKRTTLWLTLCLVSFIGTKTKV